MTWRYAPRTGLPSRMFLNVALGEAVELSPREKRKKNLNQLRHDKHSTGLCFYPPIPRLFPSRGHLKTPSASRRWLHRPLTQGTDLIHSPEGAINCNTSHRAQNNQVPTPEDITHTVLC